MAMDRATGIFVDGIGTAAATSGVLSPLGGRIFGLLYLHERPLALDEIATALEQSKSNISVNMRGLVEWHLVRRVPIAGSRKDHYEAATNFWRVFQEIMERRFRWCVRQVLATIADAERALAEGGRRDASPFLAGPLGSLPLFFDAIATCSLIAAVSFSVLVHYDTLHRFDGPPGLALGAVPALRWTLMAVVVVGIVLIAASLVVYPRSPMALFNKTVRAPRGIERVTRHALFVGVALLGAAHALLATRLVGTVLMGGLAVVAVAGAWHQDRKLLRQRGEPYAAYLEATSTVPFGAIVAGRQRLAWSELPAGALALGVVLAVVLRTVHGSIFAHG